MTANRTFRVSIERRGADDEGTVYAVRWRGKRLIDASRDPEHDSARALWALGHRGILETFWGRSKTPGLILDIASAAGTWVDEGPSTTVRLSKKPKPDLAPTILIAIAAPKSRQGRQTRGRALPR